MAQIFFWHSGAKSFLISSGWNDKKRKRLLLSQEAPLFKTYLEKINVSFLF